MYRSVAFAAITRGIDPDDKAEVFELAKSLAIEVGEQVMVDGHDATIEIRTAAVTQAVSPVAGNADVRAELVARQRAWGEKQGDAVLEGRDIGTVVFPDAALKVYLTADEAERAKRRAQEMGVEAAAEIADRIAKRDQADRSRTTGPLAIAADAVVIDSSGLAVDDVVNRVLALWQERQSAT
jgi:cytidylate kinase